MPTLNAVVRHGRVVLLQDQVDYPDGTELEVNVQKSEGELAALSSFRWSSVDDLCVRVVAALASTHPARHPGRGDDPSLWRRSTASRLLASIAPPALGERLLDLALDRDEDGWVRTHALRGLGRLALAPPTAVETLLAERGAYELVPRYEHQDHVQRLRTRDLAEVLRICGAGQALTIALAFLDQTSARERALLLLELANDAEQPRALVEALINRSLAGDRDQLEREAEVGRELNRDVLGAMGGRPEAAALLLQEARAAAGDARRECLRRLAFSHETFAELIAGDPELVREAALDLLLPGSIACEELGEAQVVEIARERIHAAPPGALDPRAARAIESLAELPQRPDHLLAIVMDPAVSPPARAAAAERLFERAPGAAIAWATRAIEAADDPLDEGGRRAVVAIARWMASDSQDAFAGVIGELLRRCDGELLYFAGHAADGRAHEARLREIVQRLDREFSSAGREPQCFEFKWQGMLRPEPLAESRRVDLRWMAMIRAQAGLARRGDPRALTALAQASSDATSAYLRAEATRWLGDVAGPRYFNNLVGSLAYDLVSPDGYHEPVAEEAAFAIAAIGLAHRERRDDALTALVRSYVAAPSNALWDNLDDYLRVLVGIESVTVDSNLWRGARTYPLRLHRHDDRSGVRLRRTTPDAK